MHLRRKSAPKDLGHLQDSQAPSLGELSGDLALETSTIHRGSMQSFRDPGKDIEILGKACRGGVVGCSGSWKEEL